MNRRFHYSLLFFLLLPTTATRTLAATDASGPPPQHDQSPNKYDGSEFNANTFIDTPFDKQTYREQSRVSKIMDRSPKAGGESSRSAHGEEGVEASEGEDKKLDRRNISELLGERTGPVHELAGDWVPDKIDPTTNGGFGVSPENGAPVPYRLNGHVDIERGKPWEAH